MTHAEMIEGMSDSRNESNKNIILLFFLALFIISLGMLGRLLWPFLSIILLAAVITSVFYPVFKLLKKKMPAVLASLTTCILLFFIMLVPIAFFVSILTREAYGLYLMAKNAVLDDQLRQLLINTRILEKINLLLSRFDIHVTTEELIRPISEMGKFVGLYLFNQVSSIAQNVLSFLINFFLLMLVSFYLFIDGPRLMNFIIELSPLPHEQVQTLIRKFEDMAGAIIIGNGLGGIFQGIMGGVAFALGGLNSPFLWGVVMSLLAFLPIVGIGLVFIPAAVYLFLMGHVVTSIVFWLFYLILSSSVEYVFKPRLVGKRVKMHTLLVFFAIVGGLKLFGILGIIYGPLVVTFFSTLADIYHSSYKRMIASNHQ
jgi:predicted PurR-regulated permease PerM